MYIRYIHCHGFTNHLGYPYGISISIFLLYVHKYCMWIYHIRYTKKYHIYTVGYKMKHDIYIYTYYTSIFLCFHPTKPMKQSATLPCITMAFSRSPTFCESFFISTFQHGSALGRFTGGGPNRGNPGMVQTVGFMAGVVLLSFFCMFVGKKQHAPGEYS